MTHEEVTATSYTVDYSPSLGNTNESGNHTSSDPQWPIHPDILNALHSLVLLCSIYVFVALVLFESKNTKRSAVRPLAQSTISSFSTSTSSSRISSYGDWLRRLCILGAALCICVCVNDLVYYNVQLSSSVACTLIKNIGVSLLINLDTIVYVFLWIRQYLVYNKLRFANRVINVILALCKWLVLVAIIGLFVVMNSILICCRRYVFNTDYKSCQKLKGDSDAVLSNLWTASSLSMHVILVALFVFPLLRQYFMYGQRRDSQNPPPSSATISRNRLMALVQRCLIVSVLCVSSDVTINLVTEHVIKNYRYSQLRHLLYNINVLGNVILITVSFKKWRAMLLPWTVGYKSCQGKVKPNEGGN